MEDLKIDSFYKMSDTWINNVRTWMAIADRYPTTSLVLRYEDLIDDTFEHLKKLSIMFDRKDEQIKATIEFSQKHTNDGGKFFWKKKSGNYEDYLDKKMIERFNDRYAGVLGEFGYGLA